MGKNSINPDWKHQFLSGRLKTSFRHFTAIVEGIAGELAGGYTCRPGHAFMTMKAWALSPDDAIDMVQAVGGGVGFVTTGHIHVFGTEPELPPKDQAFGYDLDFTPFLNPEKK
jgi:hypothetical protein